MRLWAQSLTAKHATNRQVIPSQLSMCAFYVHTHTHMYTQTHITCTLHREEDSLLFFFFPAEKGCATLRFLSTPAASNLDDCLFNPPALRNRPTFCQEGRFSAVHIVCTCDKCVHVFSVSTVRGYEGTWSL